MNYQIRYATLDDLPSIVDIYNAAIPGRQATADTEPISVESRLEWFVQHDRDLRPLWVCVKPSPDSERPMVMGWISLSSFYGRPAYQGTVEVSIYLAPTYQQQGLGTALLHHLMDYCQAREIQVLLGFIFAHNQASLRLFEKFGFETWGTLPRIAILDGVERTLLILGKHLH
jgi:phosphinothricin acetyltransferase